MRAPQYGLGKLKRKAPALPRENAQLGRVRVLQRDKRLSRNDNRVYAWAVGFNKVGNGPRF
jgi:hypothetical protein